MATVSRTWVFAANAEGFTDQGNSAGIAAAWSAGDGNPAGSLEWIAATTGTEFARDALEAWTAKFPGLPAGAIITQVQVTGWDELAWGGGTQTRQVRFRIVDSTNTTVHSAGDLFDTGSGSPSNVTGTVIAKGAGTARAVDAAFQAAATQVKFEIQVDMTGAGNYDLEQDNIAVTVTYTVPAADYPPPRFDASALAQDVGQPGSGYFGGFVPSPDVTAPSSTPVASDTGVGFEFEAASGLVSPSADELENPQGIATTGVKAIEANQGVAQTDTAADESTGGVASTVGDAIEATGGIASAASFPDEAQLLVAVPILSPVESSQGVSTSVPDAIESSGGVAAASSFVDEALAGISSLGGDPAEALVGISSLVAAVEEALQGILATGQLVVETAGGLASLAVVVDEATGGIASTGVDPIESGGLAGIVGSAAMPIEATGGIASTSGDPAEAAGGISTVESSPVEETSGLRTLGVLPVEVGQGLSAAVVGPVEALGAVLSARGEPVESLVVLSAASFQAPYESARGVLSSVVGPDEAAAAIASVSGAPLDALSAVVAVLLFPVEADGQPVVLVFGRFVSTLSRLPVASSRPGQARASTTITVVRASGSLDRVEADSEPSRVDPGDTSPRR